LANFVLTPRTADALRRLLADGGPLTGRGRRPTPTRGVTWVQVTGPADGGWHPAVVTLDVDGDWEDLDAEVLVASADGSPLAEDGRYLCTRTKDDADGTARFRTWAPPAPAFSGARVSKSSSQSIPDNTATVLTFESESFDTDGYHSTSSNTDRLTVPADGYYLVGCMVTWDLAAAGYRVVSIYRNGVAVGVAEQAGHPNATSSTHAAQSCSGLARANAGDYYTVTVLQKTGGSVTVAAFGAATQTAFWITRVG
jgi:hypothetical protein